MFIRGRRHDRQLVFKGAGPTVHLAEAHPGVRRSGRDVLPIEQVSHPLQQGVAGVAVLRVVGLPEIPPQIPSDNQPDRGRDHREDDDARRPLGHDAMVFGGWYLRQPLSRGGRASADHEPGIVVLMADHAEEVPHVVAQGWHRTGTVEEFPAGSEYGIRITVGEIRSR